MPYNPLQQYLAGQSCLGDQILLEEPTGNSENPMGFSCHPPLAMLPDEPEPDPLERELELEPALALGQNQWDPMLG